MNERRNHGRKPARKRNTERSFLIGTVIVLSVLLCLLLGWVALMLQPGPELTLEAGDPLPQPGDFFPDKSGVTFVQDISGITMDVPGTHSVKLAWGIMRYTAKLTVQDTVAPTGTVHDATVLIPNTLSPESMVTDIQDETAVTVTFAQQPDLTAPGEQSVELVLTDLGGNTTKLAATVTVIKDTQAPTLLGVRDLLTYAGGTIAYRNGITVSDDYDENVTFTPDSSQIDLSTPGTYKLVYTATDASGNTTTKEATVTVLEKRENHVELDVIYKRVDELLAQFITEDMTDRQKAEAIYVWTRIHFTYSGHTDTTDYIQSAYQFLTTKKGDCFGYFALQKLMLERLGIPTIDVKKVKNYPSDSNHYWLLVSIDGGENYYHYDNLWSKYLCLVTDARLNSFSKAVKNCFNRDESLYPPTPTEALPESKLPWNDSKILNTKP